MEAMATMNTIDRTTQEELSKDMSNVFECTPNRTEDADASIGEQVELRLGR